MFVLDVDVVSGKDGLIPRVLCEGSFSILWIPCSHGVVRVVIGVSIRSIAPWVSVLGTPYVPCRGAWVLKFGCWGSTNVEPPGATVVKLPGIVLGQELLPTRVVLVGGGILNCDRSPVKGMGGGRCANGCQVHAYRWLSSLKAEDDIVSGEWGVSEVGSRDPSSSKESQSLQMSADLLSVYKCED